MTTDENTYDYIVDRRRLGRLRRRRAAQRVRPPPRAAARSRRPRIANPWIHMPMGYRRLFANPAVNWMYESEPEPELEGRSMYQPRGKVLGGTSSINGMVYMRGNPADYDEWRQRGCTGWDWDSVLPYFKKAEDQQRGPNEFHGVGGPLRVSDQPARFELAEPLDRRRDRSRPAGQRRFQRRRSRKAPGRSRARPTRRAAGAPLPPICARRAAASQPDRPHQCAGDAHRDRERPGDRRRVPSATAHRRSRGRGARSSSAAASSTRRSCCNCRGIGPARAAAAARHPGGARHAGGRRAICRTISTSGWRFAAPNRSP